MKTVPDLFGEVKPLDGAYLDFLNALNTEFYDEPDYIGVLTFGSQYKGYARPDSDFDVILIGPHELTPRIQPIASRFGKTGHAWTSYRRSYFEGNILTQWSSYGDAIWPFLLPFVGHEDRWNKLISHLKERHARENEENDARAHDVFTYASYCLTLFETGVLVLTVGGVIVEVRVEHYHNTTRKIMERKKLSIGEMQELAKRRALMWKKELQTLAEG